MFGTSPVELMAANAMLEGAIYCESFTYTATWLTGTTTALAASVAVDNQIQSNSDSDFVVQEMNLVAFSALDTIIASPDYLIQIVLAGAGRQIFDRPQHVLNQCGNFAANKVPGKMPFPRIVQSNTTLTITLTNRTVTAANRVDLALRGFKIFYLQGDRRSIFHVL